MTISPGKYDITIYQGTTYNQQLIWKDEGDTPVDLTGYTARMMARTSVDVSTPFIDLTTENSGIILGGSAGTVTLSMDDTASSALPAVSGVYDLELIDGSGNVTRILQGNLIVSAEVTR